MNLKKTLLPVSSGLLAAAGVMMLAWPVQGQTPAAADAAQPTPPPAIHSFDESAMDKTADPCTDFYQYSCGNWVKNNPIPGDQVRWARSFSLLHERNQYLLWQELSTAAKDAKTPLQKKYGDYYAACMNTDQIQKDGLKPIEPALKQIAMLQNSKQLSETMATLVAEGSPAPLFRFGVGQDDKDSSKQIAETYQGGLSLPDREYYISPAPRYVKIRQQYVEHMTKMFTLAGDSPTKAAAEAADVLRIETALAQGSMSRTEMREPANRYHIYTLTQLESLTPDFNWTAYWKAIGIGHFDTLNVATPGFFKTLNQLIATEPASAWQAYLRWHTIHGFASNLSQPFFDENFAFFGKTLSGQKEPQPRWKQCTDMTDRALGEAVGQDWVAQNFPPQAKASMDKLVAALEQALGEDIKTLPWMTDTTKTAAAEKLALIRNKIGYPEKWRDYSALSVSRTNLIGNLEQDAIFQRNYNLSKLGKPVDEKEWGMTPPTVNAYYDPSMNDINFPAGILQPPFFDASMDPGVNFGGIGVVIGHEMTHGFDDEGSQYDGHGNLREWQTPTDRKAFTERTDCEVQEYNGFEASPAHDGLPAQHLNGKLTLGENTADNGGLRIAYLALENTLAAEHKTVDEKVGGYTEAQRFFISFAQVWCQNQTDQSARVSALVDPHSPGRWRANGSVQNFDEFGKAFGCKKGAPMYPVHSCRVW